MPIDIDFTKALQGELHPAYWDAREFTPKVCPIPPTRSPTRPTRLLSQGFDYVPASRTDITQTWRRFGWTPTVKPNVPS
jgi:hypothetical protein